MSKPDFLRPVSRSRNVVFPHPCVGVGECMCVFMLQKQLFYPIMYTCIYMAKMCI